MMLRTTETSDRLLRLSAAEWLVWLTVSVLLIAGLVLRHQMLNRAATFDEGGVALRYPADWTLLTDEEAFQVFHAVDPASSIQFPTGLRIRRIPLGELGRAASSLGDVALAWSTRQGREKPIYSILQIVPTTLSGQPAVTIDYAYVAAPAVGSAAGSIPSVVRAQDILMQHGDLVTVISFEADAEGYMMELERWGQIRSSIRVQ